MSKLKRRDVLTAMGAMGAAALLPGGCAGDADEVPVPPGAPPVTARQRGLIETENAKPGTRDWILSNPQVDPVVKWRCPWIEGYFSHASARAGDEVTLHVSTDPGSRFRADLYRMGYYGGAGARLVAELGTFQGEPRENPPVDKNRLKVCRWAASTRLRIPSEWPSGVYLAKLTAERSGVQSYAVLVVKDSRRADVLVQCSDTTWQAYNRWPSQFALYDDGRETWYWGPGVDVSFDRPYGKYCQILDAPLSTGSGEWFLWEFPLAFWLEQHGYDVTYISNLDTHADGAGLQRARGFLSVGHDEYYSLEMFNNLRAAIAAGVNVAFLSGNTCCGRIDPRPSSGGAPNRIFSRTDFYGPRDEAEIKRFPSMAQLPHRSPNANLLVGARSVAPVTGGGPWVCSQPDHWLFAGSGMKSGDSIAGLVGWEWHGDPAPVPGLVVVSTGPTDNGQEKGVYTATIYPGPKGNLVFNASTCWWADGLSAPPGYVRPSVYTTPQGPDPRVQRITANLLARMRAT